MEIFNRYPELARRFEELCQTRRNEILADMAETDDEYESLCHKRTDASMALKNVLYDSNANILFEEYADALYAQETYELDSIYKQAFRDALTILQEQGLL